MLHLFWKPAHLSVKTCYIFFGKLLRLFLEDATTYHKKKYPRKSMIYRAI